jgi:cytidylate kinase
MKLQIAIDGPSGSGKSTLAKALAKKLGMLYVDTGALYRTVGLHVYRLGIAQNESERIVESLASAKVDLGYTEAGQRVYLNGEDVSESIRMPEIAMYASAVSAIPAVRAFLLELQQSLGRTHHVIMDGRDIGTVILPNAQLKLFLIADERVRAERRAKELQEKGVSITAEEILEQQKQRDKQDSSRAVAPLKPADDAVQFDNSQKTVEASVEEVIELLKARGGLELLSCK